MSNYSSFIKLSEQEISAKTGVFLNPKTGNAWRIYVKDRELMVDVPHFSFQISPLSKTKFRPVNTLINLDIEFEQHQHSPPLMHIYAKGIKRATFEFFEKIVN